MARWLVALAVILISRPVGAGGNFQVERAARRVTTSTAAVAPAAAALPVELLAIAERAQIRARDVVAIVRAPGGSGGRTAPQMTDVLVKTRTQLVAIDAATGAVRWSQPATSLGKPLLDPSSGEILDAWIDHETHRFGIVSRDPADGRAISSIDLGSTSGWYDVHSVVIAPDGPNEVLVSAMFGVI
jgi:putative pyrroloquinoline-quinone binding quinoprotein